jgi:hypothetical protein
MTKKIENVIKTALLNGKDFQSDNGWLIRINASDNVEIWNPRGAGVETSLTFLDKAIKDFCKKADVYAPAVNQTQGKPSKVTDGELGKDTSTKDTKKLDAPEKSPRPKPKGPFTPTSLGGDTSTKPGFSDPAVNKRPKQTVNPGDTSLGSDSSGKPTNWGDKVVKIKSDGRTGKRAQQTRKVEIAISEQAAGYWEDQLQGFMDTWESLIRVRFNEEMQFADETLLEIKQTHNDDHVRAQGYFDAAQAQADIEQYIVTPAYNEAASTFDPDSIGGVEINPHREGKIVDSFSSGPDPSEIYRNLKAKRPSREMLEDIMNPEKWVANRVFAQMTENKPKRGPGMPGKGKGTYANGDAGGQLGAGCEAEGEVDKKKSPKTAGPKLREKWLNDGGYHREIESESAEELHALVQGFNNEDVDWSKFKPVMPEKDAEGADGVDPQAQAPTPATQTAKKAQGDYGRAPTPDEFTMSYMEAALWSSSDGEYESLESFDFEDIDDHSRAAMLSDCKRFQAENSAALDTYYETSGRGEAGAGHDFWLTRNHHGAGFWDRDGDKLAQTKLTEAAEKFGEVYLYVGDDGKIYQAGSEPPTTQTAKKGQCITDEFDDDSDWETNPEYWAESYINGNKSDVIEAAYSGKVDPEQIYMTLKDLDPSAADSFATSLFKRIPSHVGKNAQSTEVEAVDEDAKDVITKYMGDYGKELTKDDGVAPKKDDPKNKVKKGQAQEPAPAPAAPQAPAPKAPVAPGAPAAPAPGAPKAPGGQQSLQPGVGDAGIQALGWTKEDVQTMTDEQKQGILKIKLTKPGTQPKTQAPPQQKTPAPKAPAPQAPAAPGGEAAPTPAPGSEPAPPAPATPAPKAVKGGKSRKRSQAAPQAPVEEAPAPVAPAPQAPAQKAPAAPQANPTTKPGAGSDGSTEEQAFKILQEVQKQDVEASSANEISTAKASILIQRLMQEIGMGANEAAKLYGLPRGNLSSLFK